MTSIPPDVGPSVGTIFVIIGVEGAGSEFSRSLGMVIPGTLSGHCGNVEKVVESSGVAAFDTGADGIPTLNGVAGGGGKSLSKVGAVVDILNMISGGELLLEFGAVAEV